MNHGFDSLRSELGGAKWRCWFGGEEVNDVLVKATIIKDQGTMARFRRTRRGGWRGRSLAVLGFMCCSMLLGLSSLYAAQPDQNDMPESRVWKVQDAVHFGLKNNPDSKVALSRIDAARA
ncbi:MAG: hypothetical protein PF442_10415, partial [Desulfobulbaceae bacterium]|nr:hypothetical protein [Desulfobulbaceae bacterium]